MFNFNRDTSPSLFRSNLILNIFFSSYPNKRLYKYPHIKKICNNPCRKSFLSPATNRTENRRVGSRRWNILLIKWEPLCQMWYTNEQQQARTVETIRYYLWSPFFFSSFPFFFIPSSRNPTALKSWEESCVSRAARKEKYFFQTFPDTFQRQFSTHATSFQLLGWDFQSIFSMTRVVACRIVERFFALPKRRISYFVYSCSTSWFLSVKYCWHSKIE